MRRYLFHALVFLLLTSGGVGAGWFFVTGPTSSGGGTNCGTNGVAGQDCVSTGGSGAQWGQEVIGAPGVNPGDPGFTTTIQGGLGNTSGIGGDVDIISGIGGSLADAGAINITGADAATGSFGAGGGIFLQGGAGDTGGRGGEVDITGGKGGASSAPGNISITAGAALAASGRGGGLLEIIGGRADGSGTGGNVTVAGGPDGSTGGSLTLRSGNGGFSTADSGTITLETGPGQNSGAITLTTANANGSASPGNGGNFLITLGNGFGVGLGGAFAVQAGSGGTAASGSGIDLSVGATTGTPSTVVGDGGFSDGTTTFSGHLQIPSRTGGLFHGALSSCGSGTPTLDNTSSDAAGQVTVGGGTVTACTLTFGRPYNNVLNNALTAYIPPRCFANNVGSTPVAVSISANSSAAVTFTFASDLNAAGGKFNYFCVN